MNPAWILLPLEGCSMKRLNTHQFYELGTILHPFSELKDDETTVGDILFPTIRARWALEKQIAEGGMFLQSSKRAAAAFLAALEAAGVPENLSNISDLDMKEKPPSYRIGQITLKLRELEAVMSNDLPGIPTYFVVPKGIYSTDELISRAENHVPEHVRYSLPPKAKADICEAGKCLAFEVATGSAFHMWRAVESIMDKYYQSLTGKTFEEAKITRNWGQYIPALNKAKADKKITVFLDHIREEYRNPISHPEE